jgi:succinate dehydrogenase / fumarate reductase membrane anchor subunit
MSGRGQGHGTGHFIAERVTSIALLLLTPWFVISVALLDGGYDSARAWAAQPINAIGLGVFLLMTLYHIMLGLRVVAEDYIANKDTLRVLLGVNTFLAVTAMAVSLYALYSISIGG